MNAHPPLPPLSLDVLAFSHVPGWKLRGRCANAGNPDGMFPGEKDHKGIDAAKALCHACPVVSECLEAALSAHEPHGVWGGLTGAERTRLLKRRAKEAAAKASIQHGTPNGYRAHYRRKEKPCTACVRAARLYRKDRQDRGLQRRTKPIEHGTTAGYAAHLAARTPTCDPCRAAKAAQSAEARRRRRKGVAA